MSSSKRSWTRAIALGGLATAVWIALAPPIHGQSATAPQYDPNGLLRAPVGFETWVFVGSNLGMAYKADIPLTTALEAARAEHRQFHNVYIKPEAYAQFAATGEFPDLTVLVMEVFAAADKEPKGVLASGVFNGERVGLEVAVKNAHRPDGQATPWAYYIVDPKDPNAVTAAEPDANCESCHKAHASKDNVWVQFYPTLRKLNK